MKSGLNVSVSTRRAECGSRAKPPWPNAINKCPAVPANPARQLQRTVVLSMESAASAGNIAPSAESIANLAEEIADHAAATAAVAIEARDPTVAETADLSVQETAYPTVRGTADPS